MIRKTSVHCSERANDPSRSQSCRASRIQPCTEPRSCGQLTVLERGRRARAASDLSESPRTRMQIPGPAGSPRHGHDGFDWEANWQLTRKDAESDFGRAEGGPWPGGTGAELAAAEAIKSVGIKVPGGLRLAVKLPRWLGSNMSRLAAARPDCPGRFPIDPPARVPAHGLRRAAAHSQGAGAGTGKAAGGRACPESPSYSISPTLTRSVGRRWRWAAGGGFRASAEGPRVASPSPDQNHALMRAGIASFACHVPVACPGPTRRAMRSKLEKHGQQSSRRRRPHE